MPPEEGLQTQKTEERKENVRWQNLLKKIKKENSYERESFLRWNDFSEITNVTCCSPHETWQLS